MKKLFTLGNLWVSDFLKEGESPRGGKHDLQLVMDKKTGAVRLETTAPLNTMFGKYFYRSGINETMVKALKDVVDSILPLIQLKENDVWCDVACNDGTLLSFVPKHLLRVGIDPVEDSFKQEAEKHANEIVQDFFSAETYRKCKFGNQKIKVLTAIAVFYDLENPDNFLRDVYEVLDDEGLFVMQLSHSGLMIDQCAFDNILSEHVYYYLLTTLEPYLHRNGFHAVDVQLNDVNGGSFRVFIRKIKANPKLFATQPYRDVAAWRLQSLTEYENNHDYNDPQTWKEFHKEVDRLRSETIALIKKLKKEGKTVWAYAASTKGNTLLQYYGLDHTIIDAIAERSTFKWGLRTVGTNIPIKSEAEFRATKPDYVLILAWHFVQSFIDREKEYLDRGGKFIVPLPRLEIIGKN